MQASEAVLAEEPRWNEFVKNSPERSFMQTWQWGDVQQAMGSSIWRIVVEDHGTIIATALVIERSLRFQYSWLYIPHGPLFAPNIAEDVKQHAWKVLEEKLTSLAQERGAFFVRIDPLLSTLQLPHWRKAPREVQPQHTLLLNLSPSEQELLAAMHSKTRYNINLAQRKGVQVKFSSDVSDVQHFLRAAKDVTARSGFSYHPDEYYEHIVRVFGAKDMAELAIAEVEGEVLAVHLMVYADGIATYAHGASSVAKRQFMAPALLYWKTILRAKERGMNTYDFFGVAPEHAESDHPWSGVTRMKLGFGGTRVTYCGAYDLVLNEGLYAGFSLMRSAVITTRKAFVSLFK